MNPLCKKAVVFKVCHIIQIGEAIGQGSFGTVFKISIGVSKINLLLRFVSSYMQANAYIH